MPMARHPLLRSPRPHGSEISHDQHARPSDKNNIPRSPSSYHITLTDTLRPERPISFSTTSSSCILRSSRIASTRTGHGCSTQTHRPTRKHSTLGHISHTRAALLPSSISLLPGRDSYDDDIIKIVEVSPRDGLQNEATTLPPAIRAELVDRLAHLGLTSIEAGSFVSPKWVPQMSGTPDVLLSLHPPPHHQVSYPVLIPNSHGLNSFLDLLHTHPQLQTCSGLSEIAIFTAASDAFCLANTNCTVSASLSRLAPVVATALSHGLRVRGYVSTVIACPFTGPVHPARVREVVEKLVEMGCYEVSLGDTVGTGTPATVRALLEEVGRTVPMGMVAGHFHDTYGMGIANCATALEMGVRTLDASVGGLGGCPYSPGATGNVPTEDVLYMLRHSRFRTLHRVEDRLEEVAEVGAWICGVLGDAAAAGTNSACREVVEAMESVDGKRRNLRRETGSKVGKAVLARKAANERMGIAT